MIIEKWKNAQTYVIGKYHISHNMPCQDRTYYLEKNGVKVMALADGAGSQAHSHIGAEIVCKELCELVSENFIDILMYFEYEKTDPSKHKEKMNVLSKLVIDYLVKKLKETAIKNNVALKELSSTMLFFALKDDHYILGHIGDGVIVGLFNENNTHSLRIISDSENGAAANITFFVTDADASEHLRFKAGRVDNLVGAILSSDGAADVLFSKNGIDSSSYELFTKFEMKTSQEYNKLLSEFLSKIISNYSTDDLSLNLLCLEDNDTSKLTYEYSSYVLNKIVSKKQIIRKSQYCYFVDPSIEAKSRDFNSLEDIKRYIQWN